MSRTCQILRVTTQTELDNILKHCDDENFPNHYECSKITLKGYDCVYIGFDHIHNKVCGYVHVHVFAKFLELNAIASRSGKDIQYKGNMVTLFDRIISDAENKDFVMIDAYSPDGLRFYTRYGFKLIARTGRLVLKLKRLPTIWELRKLDVFFKMSTPNLVRLHFKKSQDSPSYQHKIYGTLDDQEGLDVNVNDISVLLAPSTAIMYPDWMYKYSKQPRPFFCANDNAQCLRHLRKLINI